MTGFTNAISTCFRKYVTFSGRARRPEYWWFALFVVLGSILFSILDGVFFDTESQTGIGGQPISTLFSVLIFLPTMAVGWRRLHDTGRPGWSLLLPIGVSLIMTLGLVLGILALGASVNAAGDTGSTPDSSVAVLGLGGVFAAVIVQLVLGVLMIWWLSRPTQEDANRFGPVPPPFM